MSKTLASPARLMRCPACGRLLPYATDNPARPFCSARCRGTDLAAWASEHYRVAAAPSGDEAGSAADDAAAPKSAH